MIILSDGYIHTCPQLIVRLACHKVDRTSKGLTAIKRGLRPADNFNSFEILQLIACDVAANENAVNKEAGIWCAKDVGHAADRGTYACTAASTTCAAKALAK